MKTFKTISIGAGGFFRQVHLPRILETSRTTVVGVVETSKPSRDAIVEKIQEINPKAKVPPFFDSLDELLKAGVQADVAVICSPHKFHCEGILAALDAGMCVLVEKPMVLNQDEARQVIAKRDATGKLVVVGFPGSLSPAVQKAKEMVKNGDLGTLTAVSAMVHQKWKQATVGSWRQDPDISGGGFLFDTGSHLINTIVDVADSPVAQLSAILDNRETPVEIAGSICGMFSNGAVFSITSAGDSFGCQGGARFIGTEAILEVGMWGHYLKILKSGKGDAWEDVSYGEGGSAWSNFLDVLDGKRENPCPPEVGLRFAQFMDMVRESAETGRCVKG